MNGQGQLKRAHRLLAGLGVAYLPEDTVEQHIAQGRLQSALDDWCPPFTGYHLYYTSRRQVSPAFSLLVEALRCRGKVEGDRARC